MRGWRLTAVTVLALAVVAGCIGTDDGALEEQTVAEQLDPEAIEAPEEAHIEEIEEGLRLVLEDVELPIQEEIEIPEGVAMVRVTAQHADDGSAIVPVLRNADSDAYRCLPSLAKAWNVGVNATTTCAGLTAPDGPNATWELSVTGSGTTEYLLTTPVGGVEPSTQPGVAERVHVDLVAEAPGGIVDRLDLDALSKPHHEIGETTYHEVESHDGAQLFVEVTTPADENHDEYPTVFVSSPYTTGARTAGERPYDDVVKDFVPRGYAVVVADVRGFGRSDGCLEVWGPNEQADQAVLVDWITDQGFSDGKVGMTGVSYVGTTPVEAAVQAPEGLEAIVTIAGVLDAYKDWHFGGVPNGESIGSPVFYQVLGTSTTSPGPLASAMDQANGVCDPGLVARANDPRAVYDGFYEARNFSARADEVEAAVLTEHGYNDVNVKSTMQLDWFNDLDVPKLGLFGHWHHQWASRADEVTLRLAWMDQFVKGLDVGLADVSTASITANGDRYREASAFPDPAAEPEPFYPDFEGEALSSQPVDGEAELLLDGASDARIATASAGDTAIVLDTTLEEPVRLAGQATLQLDVTLQGAETAYVAAYLYEVEDDQARQVTFGWANLAHRGTYDSYEPVQPGERLTVPLPFTVTEHTFEEGDELRLVLRGVTDGDWSKYRPGKPGQLVLHGGEDGTALQLPALAEGAYEQTPLSVTPTQLS